MEYRIDRFIGLDQSRDELLTEPRFAKEAKNVSTQGGGLKRAAGYARVTDIELSGGILSLAAFYQRVNGQTTTRLLGVNENGVCEWTGNSWVSVYTGVGGAASFLNYQHNGTDILLLADGIRPVLRWDGTGQMTALTGCGKKFSELALHYERVWGAGILDEPDALYWSRPFNPEDFTGDAQTPEAGGGVLLLPTFNGGRVLSLRALFGDVLVFKNEDLYRIVGTYPGNYEVVRVHGVVGPIAKNSIVSTASACYFLSREGLCAYDGVSVAPMGDERARGVFKRVNAACRGNACAEIFRNVLYLALPLDASQENNAVLEVDLLGGSCILRTGIAARSFLRMEDRLLFAGADGHIYRYGTGDTYAGAKIEAVWRAPWSDMGTPGAVKRFESVSLFGSGDFILTLTTDTSSVSRRIRLGDKERPVTVRLHGFGRRFSIRFENVEGSDFFIAPGVLLAMEAAD